MNGLKSMSNNGLVEIDERKPYLNLRWLAVLTAAPLVLAGLFVLTTYLLSLGRYDSAYFTPEYLARYHSPGSVARGLEEALRNGDQALLAELQGLRRTHVFPANENIRFVLRLDSDAEHYLTYLYFDTATFERFAYQVGEVRGRYVVAPNDALLMVRSGRWVNVAAPLALTWWVVEIAAAFMVLIYRALARERAATFGR